MKAYVVCTGFALTTVYLEYAGYDWPVFGQVGGNLTMYDKYVWSNYTAFRHIPGIRNRGVACNGMRMLYCFAD